jgi:parvulin-like peptidyl-prolyl isomerase
MTTDPRSDAPLAGSGRGRWLGLLLAAACVTAFAADAGAANPFLAANAAPAASLFAKVGETVISHQEFDAAFAQAARAKFYHGKPPENAVATLQREVGQAMVDELLLAGEARRRKLQPDHAAIKKTLDGYEERYRGSEQWNSNRARLLPGLKSKLERDSLLEQLGKQVQNVGEPTQRQLEQYWEANQDKFTAPEQVHLAMILLKVEPSSPQAKWDGARDEGAAIVKRLRSGADFKQLAQLHSSDASAERGGDMGYVHHGMLPEPAQKAIDQLKPGQISDAVVLLEGVAVFRLEDRKSPKLNALDAVRDRARDLWLRDKREEARTSLLTRLRRETSVKLDESRFLPLATAATSGESVAPR